MSHLKFLLMFVSGTALLVGLSLVLNSPELRTRDVQEFSEKIFEAQKKREARQQALRPAGINPTTELTSLQKRQRMRHESPSDAQELVAVYDRLEGGDISGAESMLQKLVVQHPSRSEFLVELAMIQLFDHKNQRAALEYFKKALVLTPGHLSLQEEAARTFAELKAYREGLEFFENLAKQAPNAPGIPYILAKLRWANQQLDEALALLGQAVQNPHSRYTRLKSYALKSRILISMGNLEEGTKDLEIAVDGYENEIRTKLLQNANIALMTEELDELMILLADVNFRQKKYDRAYDINSKLAERIPGDDRVISMFERLQDVHTFSSL